MSIQAGGGGVDVASWSDEECASECEEQVEEELIAEEAATTPPPSSPLRGLRQTHSESHAEARDEALQSEEGSILLPRPSPRRGTTLTSPVIPTDVELVSPPRRRRRTGHDHLVMMSPTLASGFTIGLSPLSPGFAPVPKERGSRRASGLTFSDVVNDAAREGGIGGSSGRRRRRTVSEGDVDRAIRGIPGVVSEPGISEEQGARGEEDVRRKKARMRWRWLRRAFRT